MKFLIIPAVLATLLLSCSKSIPYHDLPFDGQSVSIDITGVRENQPEFYSVVVDGKKLSFFIVRINGEIQSYFNACARCYPRKLGFNPDGGDMRCRSCNAKYPLDELKEGIGSCCPIRLKGIEKKNTYVIARESLLKGIKFF
ncbi:MAG: Fe-S-containing protein [Candidatus Sulfobium sp.]|jgi:uncharacterized membrane protein